MSSSASAQPSPPLGLREVGDMLEILAAADLQLAHELDRIGASRSPVSAATVAALERLLMTLRPAAGVREQLSRVDLRVLAAAVRLRRHHREDLYSIGGAAGGQH